MTEIGVIPAIIIYVVKEIIVVGAEEHVPIASQSIDSIDQLAYAEIDNDALVFRGASSMYAK